MGHGPQASGRSPAGTPELAAWAASRGFAFDPFPPEAWFRRFEPFDTMAPPSRYLNACTLRSDQGSLVVVEPWMALDDAEPLGRTLLAFATHGALRGRAAVRIGADFMTRTLFLEGPPPRRAAVGGPEWDRSVETFSASDELAASVVTPALRAWLAAWTFEGHLELRTGALVLHRRAYVPTPACCDRLVRRTIALVNAALGVAPPPPGR